MTSIFQACQTKNLLGNLCTSIGSALAETQLLLNPAIAEQASQ